ncbi:T9SS type A sorting domain-containing protein, partial [Hymenobacter lucidus]
AGPGGGGTPGSGPTGGAGSAGSFYSGGGGGGYYGGGGAASGGSGAGGGGGSSWAMPTSSADISYDLAPVVGPGSVTIVAVALPDLVVSAAFQNIEAGLYNSITVQNGTFPLLGGPVGVYTSITVQNGGYFDENCQVLSGPGSFTLSAGSTLRICSAQGFSGSGATGSIQVTGPRSFSADASYQYNGTVAQVTGPGLPATVRGLALDNSMGLTLTSPVTVSTEVSLFYGVLSTGAHVLTLGPTAMLTEYTNSSYALGRVQTTRTLSTAGTTESFGGLGLTLTPGGSVLPGSTLVIRTTGTALSGVGSSRSVRRYFDIQPTVKTGLRVDLALTIRDDERNGIAPASLRLFKSENPGGPWQAQPAATFSTTAATHTAHLAGVSRFSLWTLGDASNPLPVELKMFTATATGPQAVRLAWTTASEVNSAAFEVERSADGQSFAALGTVAAAGRSSTARRYELLDTQLPGGVSTVYYRLRQVDLDGTFSYSPVRPVVLSGAGAGLSLFPNPTQGRTTTLTDTPPRAAVTVFDALGRPVATATADTSGTAVLVLPAGLPAGVYVVRAGQQAIRLTLE